MKPVRFKFRLNVWPEQYNFVSREVSGLVSLKVFFNVRRQIYGSVMQKIMDKLEGRVDGTR